MDILSNVPQFVTPEMYENYWGEDLNVIMKGYGNKVNLFLKQVEDELMTHIDATTSRNFLWDKLTDWQLQHFQYAVIIQAKYEIDNGRIGMDSGFDPERGFVGSQNDLDSASICRQCIKALKEGALYNQNISNKNRFTRFY